MHGAISAARHRITPLVDCLSELQHVPASRGRAGMRRSMIVVIAARQFESADRVCVSDEKRVFIGDECQAFSGGLGALSLTAHYPSIFDRILRTSPAKRASALPSRESRGSYSF